MSAALTPCPRGLVCRADADDPLPEDVRLEIASTLSPHYVGFVAWSGSPEPGRHAAFYLDARAEAWTLWRRGCDPARGEG